MRNPDWQDDHTIAVASVQTSPNSFKTHRLLGENLLQSDPSYVRISIPVIAMSWTGVTQSSQPVNDEDNLRREWALAGRPLVWPRPLDREAAGMRNMNAPRRSLYPSDTD